MRVAVVLALVIVAAPAWAQEASDGNVPPEQIAPPPPAPPPPYDPPRPPPQLAPPPPLALQPPPPIGYVKQRRWGLFATGAGVFGAAWLGTLLDALNAEKYTGLIPLAGPFLLFDRTNGNGTNAILILDGLAQIAGVTVAIIGLTLPRKIPIYALVPTTNGLAIAGRF